ncbi:MAG: hypothetical protein H7250_09060, partial [Flavobacterium sp.]|nr:hypothetical protein [Flavobacterium sp.]
MKTEEQKTDKSFIEKNQWIIIPFILIMGYLVFTQYKSLMEDRKEKEVWNNEDSKVMVNQC